MAKRKKVDASANTQATAGPSTATPGPSTTANKKRKAETKDDGKGEDTPQAKRPKRVKLGVQPPWPSVPTSSNATGPRSARAEGNNRILVSRKVPLGAYLRRCKEAVLNHGYKTLYLSAMTAAIPHLLLLVTSFPETIPYHPDEIKYDYQTGTVKSMDEIQPDSDDDDETAAFGQLVERKSSSLMVTITIGDGLKEVTGNEIKRRKESNNGRGKRKRKQRAVATTADEREAEMSTGSDD